MIIKIEKISPSADGETVLLDISLSSGKNIQTEKKIISAAQFYDLGLSTAAGQILSTDKFDEISRAAQVTAAIKKGIDLLAYAQSTKKGLSKKLVLRGYPKEISDEAAEYLEKVGYISEKSQAEALVRNLAEKKLYGPSRIKSELFSKSYSEDAIAAALDTDIDYDAICAERIRKTVGTEVFSLSRESRGKAINSLMRYGFSMQNIRSALETLKNQPF